MRMRDGLRGQLPWREFDGRQLSGVAIHQGENIQE